MTIVKRLAVAAIICPSLSLTVMAYLPKYASLFSGTGETVVTVRTILSLFLALPVAA